MSFLDAACLPTAWLTAYHMLTTRGRVAEAEAVLVQGAGGGVATAAVVLAAALGKRVYATSRDAAKRERIAELGAAAVEPGARLPERVDVVIESVGAPTFEHSLKCAAPGARIVVCGATGGHVAQGRPAPGVHDAAGDPRQLDGHRRRSWRRCWSSASERDIRPVIDSTYGFSAVARRVRPPALRRDLRQGGGRPPADLSRSCGVQVRSSGRRGSTSLRRALAAASP